MFKSSCYAFAKTLERRGELVPLLALLMALGFIGTVRAQTVVDLLQHAPDVVLKTPFLYSDLGYAFAAGDLNADSHTDLLIGAPGLEENNTRLESAVYGFWGGKKLPALVFAPDVSITGHPVGSGAGFALACRDLNNDKIDDLIVGAPYANRENELAVGVVEIWFGRKDFPAQLDFQTHRPNVLIYGAAAGDQFGRVITTGDCNGDGLYDLIVAAPGASTANDAASGIVYVIFGRAEWNPIFLRGPGFFEVLRLLGKAPNNLTASSLVAGNFNGDRFADLLIGAHKANAGPFVDGGESYVVFGRSQLPATLDLKQADLRITGAGVRDFSGWAVSAAGFNRDGVEEVIIGAPGAKNGALTTAGRAYFLDPRHVPADTFDLAQTPGLASVLGPHRGSGLATYLSTADVNNDGTADVLFGIPADVSFSGRANAGAVAVLYGRSGRAGDFDLQISRPDLAIAGDYAEGMIGSAFIAADFDGDAKTDIALKKKSGSTGNHTVYLLYGASLRTAVAAEPTRAERSEVFTLAANYPNPFNRETRFVVGAALPLAVEIVIYDVTGRRVRTLHRGQFAAPQTTLRWNGVDDNGERVVSGLYFVCASANVKGQKFVRTMKLSLF